MLKKIIFSAYLCEKQVTLLPYIGGVFCFSTPFLAKSLHIFYHRVKLTCYDAIQIIILYPGWVLFHFRNGALPIVKVTCRFP
jgi:hypothetical protein